MVDERDLGFYELWSEDPLPLRRVSLRYLQSVGSSPPAIRFEDNHLPILVINPTRDRMTPPAITEQNFRRLSGPAEYAPIDFGHWSVSASFAREWAGTVDGWLRKRSGFGRG